ncbi:hypothetical protein Prudu_004407 [Prunus dulcis]|uniref:Uncharacterized protein n=1 Tax=Prunus dulcis TaxID=3755 RepID=A0A4Y1QVE1_PRUDU|nr:hypothetical protein Prudu_004407 [Prunus dulcis]
MIENLVALIRIIWGSANLVVRQAVGPKVQRHGDMDPLPIILGTWIDLKQHLIGGVVDNGSRRGRNSSD